MAETFYFEIIASDKKFYSGACEHVIFPAVDGLYGVLANHEDTVLQESFVLKLMGNGESALLVKDSQMSPEIS